MSDDGRHYLLTHNGATFHDTRPAYLMTAEEADDSMRQLRATYGGNYAVIDAEVPATCTSNHPGNSSHCERLHGHKGLCHYVESMDGKRRTWKRKTS